MKIEICHLYPDVLNLYGDNGNILCLQKRLSWRGVDSAVTRLPIGDTADFTKFDIFFIGGGQDFEQEVLLADLARGKAAEIKSAIADGKTFLAICGGYQMLGRSYTTWDGKVCDFIGAIDYETKGAQERMIGNFAFRCGEISGGSTVVGFENHSGRTYLGRGVQPLGMVLSGSGNNGEDGTEGVRDRNVFGTYSHGPVLPKNPEFADALLRTALEQKSPGFTLDPIEDTLEMQAHDYMMQRLGL